jgi:hypothetical protein
MPKISGLTAITTVSGPDLLVAVDVDDTTMAATGTDKQMTLAQLQTFVQTVADYAPSGLTGATAASRYVGATASGAPASGTFALGDFVIDQSGKVWICTTAGTPGTWTQVGITPPLTTLGDLLYENATPALARLAGNTTTTKKFLTQTGTGSVSAAPGWNTIVTGDLPAAQHPWQFAVDDPAYGAKGDVQVCTDVSTNGTNVITSATISADPNAVGKRVIVNGGRGLADTAMIGVISSVNGTNVTLNTSATGSTTSTATASSLVAAWGTDDTAAINSAISAAATYAQANDYYAEVIFGAKIYMAGSSVTQVNSGGLTYNAIFQIPPPTSNVGRKLEIAFIGANRNDQPQFWASTLPSMSGSCILAARFVPTPDATYGWYSVLGGPTSTTGITGTFLNQKAVLRNLSIWCPYLTNFAAFDFRWLGGCYVDGYSSHIFANAASGTSPKLSDLASNGQSGVNGVGGFFPLPGNNDDVRAGSMTAEGYTVGIKAADHFIGGRIACLYAYTGLSLNVADGITSSSHLVSIQSLSAEVCYTRISAESGAVCEVDIHLDVESAGAGYDIDDSGGSLHGTVYWQDTSATRAPAVNGGADLRVVNNQLHPGHWASPPAVPGSTSPQQNTAWRDAAVTIATGAGVTVSVIAVDGTATGATLAASSSTTVIVPAGKNITLTYAGGTPTWVWNLL